MGRIKYVRVVSYWSKMKDYEGATPIIFAARDLARTGLYGTIHSSLYYGGAH